MLITLGSIVALSINLFSICIIRSSAACTRAPFVAQLRFYTPWRRLSECIHMDACYLTDCLKNIEKVFMLAIETAFSYSSRCGT